jgi:putative ABC transport system substrate-binding protein
VTGLLAAVSAPSKLIELLLEAVPGVQKIGVLYNPTNPGNVLGINSLKSDTAKLPITLFLAEGRGRTDIESAFQRFGEAEVGGLLVSQDALFTGERHRIADLALALRLPIISGFRIQTGAGGLMSYGTNFPQRYFHAGEYAAKILRGAKPGDLPIQLQPKLELVINLKTAKALGVKIPLSILARADEVIE